MSEDTELQLIDLAKSNLDDLPSGHPARQAWEFASELIHGKIQSYYHREAPEYWNMAILTENLIIDLEHQGLIGAPGLTVVPLRSILSFSLVWGQVPTLGHGTGALLSVLAMAEGSEVRLYWTANEEKEVGQLKEFATTVLTAHQKATR